MAAWRAMTSLLVLRDQADEAAPARSRASDGLVGDAAHQGEVSDHNPHPVAGVGPAMVSALDLTHDPAHGFDSYKFAEVLRVHRDPRIKYVISNRRIFDSSGSDAWTWRPYSGSDPHTNHVHISVLDAKISDTSTPWNLEGFITMALTEADLTAIGRKVWNWDLLNGAPVGVAYEIVLAIQAQVAANAAAIAALSTKLDSMDTKLTAILVKLEQGGGSTFPPVSTFGATGTITWTPQA